MTDAVYIATRALKAAHALNEIAAHDFRVSFPARTADCAEEGAWSIHALLTTLHSRDALLVECIVTLKLFTCASMHETRPSHGESFIGWQSGMSAQDRLDVADTVVAKIEASTRITDEGEQNEQPERRYQG